MSRVVVFLLVGVLVSGCDASEDVESSFQMPVKENTWVRKEAVRKTQNDSFVSRNIEVSVDSALATRLRASTPLSVNTKQECLQRANAFDKTRVEVQKRGGLWHAYEKAAETKPYSNYGMQLDSQTNRLVFSLKHICENTERVQLNGWGTETVRRFKEMGEDGFRKYFSDLGEVKGDIDNLVRFAEFAIDSENRKVTFSKIGESLAQAKTLIDFYDNLSQQKIAGDIGLKTFIIEGATLLSVINESLKADPRLILALQDEMIIPFDDIEGEM
jgi:hypothetical protein